MCRHVPGPNTGVMGTSARADLRELKHLDDRIARVACAVRRGREPRKFWCPESEIRWQNRLTLVRISSAVFVYTKGFAYPFVSVM
jgi:hypothetical protein